MLSQVQGSKPVVNYLSEQAPGWVPAVEKWGPVTPLLATERAVKLVATRTKGSSIERDDCEASLRQVEVDGSTRLGLRVALIETGDVGKRMHPHDNWEVGWRVRTGAQ